MKDKPVADTVREQGAVLKELAKFNGEIGVQGGWQQCEIRAVIIL